MFALGAPSSRATSSVTTVNASRGSLSVAIAVATRRSAACSSTRLRSTRSRSSASAAVAANDSCARQRSAKCEISSPRLCIVSRSAASGSTLPAKFMTPIRGTSKLNPSAGPSGAAPQTNARRSVPRATLSHIAPPGLPSELPIASSSAG